jgi:hypothetical protein
MTLLQRMLKINAMRLPAGVASRRRTPIRRICRPGKHRRTNSELRSSCRKTNSSKSESRTREWTIRHRVPPYFPRCRFRLDRGAQAAIQVYEESTRAARLICREKCAEGHHDRIAPNTFEAAQPSGLALLQSGE